MMAFHPIRSNWILAGLIPLALTGCMQPEAEGRRGGPIGPAARVTGPPVNCLSIAQFNDTRIRDDQTIDFMRNSRQGWRNTLPNRCPGLAVRNAFTYRTSISELCSVDIITVLDTVGGGLTRGASCGLGQFVPIELERRR